MDLSDISGFFLRECSVHEFAYDAKNILFLDRTIATLEAPLFYVKTNISAYLELTALALLITSIIISP
jgi:hypothetical protein